ncbi:YdbH family protein [Rahnella sp. Lac-M11]|uniref:YdbH family protein n=1 Tax=Rahnella contaminans TaxID=2703882 RepID=A0A6M2B0M7_9GAMM|nr:YdbH family protein [Rahnella contaminans]NGX85987.1 YdbH family protein [Rahnella contaminans]
MRNGLKRSAQIILSIVVILALLMWGLWKTVPRWLPPVASHWLPKGTQLTLSGAPHWSDGVLQLPGLRYSAGECALATAENARLSKEGGHWALNIDALKVDTACLAQLPKSDASTPLSVADLQHLLPDGRVNVTQLSVTPWQRYAGQVQLSSEGGVQHLTVSGDALKLDAVLGADRTLAIHSFSLIPPGSEQPVTLSGKLLLPATFDQLPESGELHAEIQTAQVPSPLDILLSWQTTEGELTLTEKGSDKPLAILPWKLNGNALQISQGQWRWPYAAQPLAGGVNLTLSDWSPAFDQTNITARLNVLTQGHNGKANVVLSMGPGRIGLLDSHLGFRLTGQANLQATSLSASLPGELSGSVLNPTLLLRSGSLLRAWGKPTPELTISDARWPLAGVKVSAQGVSGPLQAILKASHRFWGKFDLHLSGKSQEFWPDAGQWDFNYWGNGHLPPLSGRWDMSGKGQWHDNRISINSLSTGFDRLHYGLVDVEAPRLTLDKPLVWLRSPAARFKPQYPDLPTVFKGDIKLVAKKIALTNGGYLPPATLVLQLSGDSPDRFGMRGMLDARPIGPIRLTGRWDGERLRGEAWWPKQQLTSFQTLLTPDLNIKLRDGSFYAQSAFSAARGQGFVAGGHWVVKNGGLWMKDGDLSGLDFSLPYRLQDSIWQLGVKKPVTLRIGEVNNLVAMKNITADLQGHYPWSEDKPLTLTNLGVDMLRGHLSLSALRMPQHDAAVLKLEKINLSELFTALKPKQLAMSGVIYGELPLFVENPKWIIQNGWIKNDGGLTLRLDPQFADAMASGNFANKMVVSLLRYMEISRSDAQVSLDNLGMLTMAAKVDGVNYTDTTHGGDKEKREIVLNYTHQENIYQLWRSLRFGDNLQDWLQQEVSLPADALSKGPVSAGQKKEQTVRKEQ